MKQGQRLIGEFQMQQRNIFNICLVFMVAFTITGQGMPIRSKRQLRALFNIELQESSLRFPLSQIMLGCLLAFSLLGTHRIYFETFAYCRTMMIIYVHWYRVLPLIKGKLSSLDANIQY